MYFTYLIIFFFPNVSILYLTRILLFLYLFYAPRLKIFFTIEPFQKIDNSMLDLLTELLIQYYYK